MINQSWKRNLSKNKIKYFLHIVRYVGKYKNVNPTTTPWNAFVHQNQKTIKKNKLINAHLTNTYI